MGCFVSAIAHLMLTTGWEATEVLVSPTFVPWRWTSRTQPPSSDGGGHYLVRDNETKAPVEVFAMLECSDTESCRT